MKDIVLTNKEYNELKETIIYKTYNNEDSRFGKNFCNINILENKTEEELSKIDYIKITQKDSNYKSVFKTIKLIEDINKTTKIRNIFSLICCIIAVTFACIFIKDNKITESILIILLAVCVFVVMFVNEIYDNNINLKEKIDRYNNMNVESLGAFKIILKSLNVNTIFVASFFVISVLLTLCFLHTLPSVLALYLLFI